MEKWYPRLADVPRVGYQGSPGVDRTRLPGYNARPRIERYEFGGRRREALYWPSKEGSTSAAPATQLESTPRPGESTAQTVLRHCHEALELPGRLMDYHFIIQGAHEALWKYRRSEPWTVAQAERLCWLNLRLIEAHPEAITFEEDLGREVPRYPRVLAFYRLMRLYEQEGYLRDALAVAKIAVRFQQLPNEVERLEAKVKLVEAEEEVG